MSLLKKLDVQLPKLPDLGRAVSNAAKDVANAVSGAANAVEKKADGFAQDLRSEAVKIATPVKNVVLPSLDVTGIKLPKIKVPDVVVDLFGTTRPELNKFVDSTRDFRATLETLRTTPKTDPKYAAAAAHLQSRYGYTPESAPKPGTQWISPRLSGELIPGGQVNASKWPTGTGTTEPADPAEALFAYGKKPTLRLPDGRDVVVNSPAEYKALVAETRAKLGITNPDGSPAGGELKGVHLTMEGGGGLGKRYSPVFTEMYAMGIVPASVSGTSVGAIAAGYIAAGADPATVHKLATDPALAKFFDFKPGESALMDGKFMYQYVDQKLRELTGIKDRPVTFADLKIPLHLPAAIMSDSMPPAGTDYTKPENRLFTFGPESTPNTPVVYAMLASGAFPGVLPTVDLVDPTTGRKLVLTDSGVIDGIPMDMGKSHLPEIGLTLQEPHSNHPGSKDHNTAPKPLPPGDIDTSNPVAYALNSLKMLKDSGASTKDFIDRTQPKAGEFMFAVPIFDVNDARKTDNSLKFDYDPKIDPALDEQGRALSREFFKKVFNDIGDPKKSATNIITQVPKNLTFERAVDFDGKQYTAQYTGGDHVLFTRADGSKLNVKVGKIEVEAMFLDELIFKSLEGELKVALDHHLHPWKKVTAGLPF